jgi:hypothetical protein
MTEKKLRTVPEQDLVDTMAKEEYDKDLADMLAIIDAEDVEDDGLILIFKEEDK